MRTLLFLLAGFLLMGGFLLLGKLFAGHYPDSARVAMVAFIVVWFVIAAANMWLGVAKAGYSVAEELPIFLLIFGGPAVVAMLLKWQFP
jgi:hypothetical protein